MKHLEDVLNGTNELHRLIAAVAIVISNNIAALKKIDLDPLHLNKND